LLDNQTIDVTGGWGGGESRESSQVAGIGSTNTEKSLELKLY